MRSASPSTIAVLPTPGSPISTGLFLVRRASTWMVRRISSSRPITGSSFCSRASCRHIPRIFLQRVEIAAPPWRYPPCAPCGSRSPPFPIACARRTGALQRAPRRRVARRQRHQQPVLCDETRRPPWSPACCAASSTRTSSGVILEASPAPLPCTFGNRPTAASTASFAAVGSPPAARINPEAAPFLIIQ